jgi:probable rRNA maturation factor
VALRILKNMSQKQPPIYFHYLTAPFYFPNRSGIKDFLLSLFNEHSKKVENINYIFCTDDYLLKLNADYLDHNYYTDIITFELSAHNEALISDVYISVDRARENSKLHLVPQLHEVIRLMIHGALHLCGQNDKSEQDFNQMKQLEDFYLNKWFHVKQKRSQD